MPRITADQLLATAHTHGWHVTRRTDLTWTAERDGAHVTVKDSPHGFWCACAAGIPGLDGHDRCLRSRTAVDEVLRGGTDTGPH